MMTDPLRVLLHNETTDRFAAKLKEAFPRASIAECNDYESVPETIAHHLPDVVYTVRFAGSTGFPVDALMSETGPKWIANGGAGIDHLGHWDVERKTVTNGAGVAADMMAEYIMGCFLHFSLDIPGFQADKSARVWTARTVRPLKGKSILIVGLGHTGRAVAKRAKAFGMVVMGTRANPTDMDYVDKAGSSDELLSMLPKADYVAVCTPLTPATRGLIGVEAVAAMKHGVVFADVSRGLVTDQNALLSGLESGRITAAALDVFETEPLPEDSPLWQIDNLIISPHCSSVHDEWEDAAFDLFLSNLERWITGKPLFNVVDPERGY